MQEPASTTGREPRKLLVRGVNWLGDAVMTTPALQRLRERFSDAHIAILTQAKLAGLWEPHPCVDAVLTLQPSDSVWRSGRILRRLGFDTAVVFPNSPRSAIETWLAHIPCRIGYANSWRSWLLTHPIIYSPSRLRPRRLRAHEVRQRIKQSNGDTQVALPQLYEHQTHNYLRLVAELGCNPAPLPPKLLVTEVEIDAALRDLNTLLRSKSRDQGGSAPILVGINVSAAYGSAKCWPIDRFAAVTREVNRVIPNCAWLSFGTETDWELGERLSKLAGLPVVNLAGKTSLRQLMALLKSCRVLLTNDSGPMHVAAALGTAVVAPFGSTSPDLTAPGEPGDPRHRLLTSGAPCSPCFRRTCPIDFRCMTAISVEQVVTAVLAAMKGENPAVS